jgi:hypothetical protein
MPDGFLQGALMAGYGLGSDWLAAIAPEAAADYRARLRIGAAMAALATSPRQRFVKPVTVLAVDMLLGGALLTDGTGRHYQHRRMDYGACWDIVTESTAVATSRKKHWLLTESGKEWLAEWAMRQALGSM